MAKVLTGKDGVTHLRSDGTCTALCGELLATNAVSDGELTCPECAKVALLAVELVTKAEKRLWRQL
jgi:hypothetical protein